MKILDLINEINTDELKESAFEFRDKVRGN